jgi:alpha-L-fucosidase
MAPNDDFVSTQKGKTVYLHLLNPELNVIHIDEVPVKIKSISDLKSKKNLSFRNDKFGLVIDVSNLSKDPIDTVIQIEIK